MGCFKGQTMYSKCVHGADGKLQLILGLMDLVVQLHRSSTHINYIIRCK